MIKIAILLSLLSLGACSFTSTATPTPLGRLMFGLMIQEPEELPPGHVCVRSADVRGSTDHPCNCQRKCVPSEDADGNQTITVQEDAQCRSFCHKEHCSCPVKECD